MTKRHVGFKEVSQSNWGRDHDDQQPFSKTFDVDAVQLGCIMRIADAVEKMANNYGKLIAERDDYQRRYNNGLSREARLERQLAATRGNLTRLKRKPK